MNIKPFAVEEWMNEYEVGALYNIAETCVDSVSLDELFELTGENKEDFLKDFCAQRLTYGDIWGSEALRSGISKLYHTIKADEVVLTHGAAGAYILCDEVYRHLTQEDEWCESIVDLYEKGISVSSMSKVFSLAGLRMGWTATHDEAARKAFLSHRDYNLISCGMFDDAIASIALRHSDVMLKRNQRIVRENLAILDDWIKENPHFFYTKPKAGTTALVYYDFDIPSYEFCKRMYHETGAFVTPGDCFEQPHSMRIGYACDIDTLKDGLAAVTKFAATL